MLGALWGPPSHSLTSNSWEGGAMMTPCVVEGETEAQSEMPGSSSHSLSVALDFELRGLTLTLLDTQPHQALGFRRSLLILYPNPALQS